MSTSAPSRIRRRTWIIVGVAAVLVVAVALVAWRFSDRIAALFPAPVVAAVTENAAAIHDDGQTVIAEPKTPNGKLVVYMHGSGQSPRSILTDERTTKLTAPLLAAGYVVAAAEAGGDSWGDADSVAAYDQLVEYASAEYGTTGTYAIAASMGGLSAAQVVEDERIRAWAAIYPVCDIASITQPKLVEQIQKVYPDGAPADLSPVAWPDVPVMVWASPDDTYVPAESNGFACAAEAGVEPVVTVGEHNDLSNYDPDAVLAFFASN